MTLPFPGSPAATWARSMSRMKAVFDGANPRVCAAFWLFGLINNVLYVIILSAALDLVGPGVPKGVVLLADVLPSFGTKLIAPYFIHLVPYSMRIPSLAAISIFGMLLVALTPDGRDGGKIGLRMVGIMMASLSSGGGELSFLGLTHYYGQFSLAAWGSGTGGAGLVGAGAYVVATTSLGLSVRASLITFSFLPFVMIASFFFLLPREVLNAQTTRGEYGPLLLAEENQDELNRSTDLGVDETENENGGNGLSTSRIATGEDESLLSRSAREFDLLGPTYSTWGKFKTNFRQAQKLFIPYMLPLLLVYIAEYTINQGVAPTLLFPLSSSPFKHYRSFYPVYNAIYQVGVFLSRSSTPFFRIHALYLPSSLQVLNLAILTLQALYNFIPSVYFIFAIIFWEGLLGGLVYVSTFAEISDNVPAKEREFSLSATSVSDSAGICMAGFIGMAFELWLCNWQVRHGREYCTKL